MKLTKKELRRKMLVGTYFLCERTRICLRVMQNLNAIFPLVSFLKILYIFLLYKIGFLTKSRMPMLTWARVMCKKRKKKVRGNRRDFRSFNR